MKVAELLESKAGVVVAQSKKTQATLRAAGTMEAPGHYHKKGGDWESTKIAQLNGRRRTKA